MNKAKFIPPSIIEVGNTHYNIEYSACDKNIDKMVLGMLDVMRKQAAINAEMYAMLEDLMCLDGIINTDGIEKLLAKARGES